MRGRGMDRGVVLGGTCPSTCERIGTSLSRPIRPHRHRVRCRRHHRYARPYRRAEAERGLGPIGVRGESSRRQRQYRWAAAAQSPADGYTLHLGGQVLAVNVTLAPMKGLDPIKDFEPIMWIATAQDVLMVPPDSPFRSVKELVDYAKAHPGELNYASLGIGSSGHLATTLFSDLAGIKVQHVPYTSFSQAVTDMISGRISLWITTLGGAIGNIRAGKMRALAVSGSARAAQLPDVPTFNEHSIGLVDESCWYALFAPRGDAQGDRCQDQR